MLHPAARFALLATLALADASRASCPVFTIENGAGGPQVRKEVLEEGEVAVYVRDVRGGTIDLVWPVGPGRSAGFVRVGDADKLVVRFANGRLTGEVRRAFGDPVVLEPRALDELRGQDVRVCVTVTDSTRRAFLVSGWETVEPDSIGPVENMFAGRLPAAVAREGAVVQTETWAREPAVRACGRAELERDGWLFTRVDRGDGTAGWFVVDLAASESVVARSFLPAGTAVTPLSALERSAAGTRALPYAPEGATGTVASVAGSATLPALVAGGLRFVNPSLVVLEDLPDVFGRPVAGILGMDLLRGCDHLRLELPARSRNGALVLADEPAPGPVEAETPFSFVHAHLMVRGRVDDADASWILDTGSPGTVVDSVGAPPLHPSAVPAAAKPLRGLDGAGVGSVAGIAKQLAVGARTRRDVEYRVAPLAVFAPLRQPGTTCGVLGLSALADGGGIDVDFRRRVVRWLRAR